MRADGTSTVIHVYLRRIALWMAVTFLCSLIFSKVFTLGGSDNTKTMLAFSLLYMLLIVSSLLIFTDSAIYSSMEMWLHKFVRKRRLFLLMWILILFSVYVLEKFLDFRYDFVPSTSKSSTPLFIAFYNIGKVSIFHRSFLRILLSFVTISLDIMFNFGEVGAGMCAAFIIVRQYEQQGLRRLVLKEPEETEEGLETDKKYLDNKGENQTAESVKDYLVDNTKKLWAIIVVPSVKRAFFLTLLSCLMWLVGTGLAMLRCGKVVPTGDTQTSSASESTLDSSYSSLITGYFQSIIDEFVAASVDVDRLLCNTDQEPLGNTAYQSLFVSIFVQISGSLTFLLLREILVQPLNIMRFATHSDSSVISRFFGLDNKVLSPESALASAQRASRNNKSKSTGSADSVSRELRGDEILTDAMSAGLEVIRWDLPSWADRTGNNNDMAGQTNVARAAGGHNHTRLQSGIARWQEVWQTQKSIYAQLLHSLQISEPPNFWFMSWLFRGIVGVAGIHLVGILASVLAGQTYFGRLLGLGVVNFSMFGWVVAFCFGLLGSLLLQPGVGSPAPRLAFLQLNSLSWSNLGGGSGENSSYKSYYPGQNALKVIARSAAFANFAQIASARSQSLRFRREQLYNGSGFSAAATACIAYMDAVAIQLQIAVAHTQQEMLLREVGKGARGRDKNPQKKSGSSNSNINSYSYNHSNSSSSNSTSSRSSSGSASTNKIVGDMSAPSSMKSNNNNQSRSSSTDATRRNKSEKKSSQAEFTSTAVGGTRSSVPRSSNSSISGSGRGRGQAQLPKGMYRGEALQAQLPHSGVGADMSSWELNNPCVIAPEVTRAVKAASERCGQSFLGKMAEWVLTQENMTYFWPTSFALVGANPISEQDVLSPLTIQTCQMASRGLAHALYSSLREDTSGTAQCYVVAAVESMVRLQCSLESYDECARMVPPAMFGAQYPDADFTLATLYDEVGVGVDMLGRGFYDILSRADCPLAQDPIVAGPLQKLLQR